VTDATALLDDRLMPRLEPDVVADRVAAHWTMARDTFPVPAGGWLACPVCGETQIQLARYHFHTRENSATRFRCDVQLKCTGCSYFWTHGVVVDEGAYEQGMGEHLEEGKHARVWQYREVADELGLDG